MIKEDTASNIAQPSPYLYRSCKLVALSSENDKRKKIANKPGDGCPRRYQQLKPMRKYPAIILLVLLASLSYADPYPYNKVALLKKESKNLLVIHYHDWSNTTKKSRFKMISTHQNPFTEENDYAFILAINKNTQDTIFNSPSPALTKIHISEDEKFIVGISNIMVWNPYQLVIYSDIGELIFKKHIADSEAKLDEVNYESFKKNYPKQHNLLESMDRIDLVNGHYYLDFLSMDMPNKLGDAWNYLFKFKTPNHLSGAFSETVTNWVYWYFEDSPKLKVELSNDQLYSISLLDPDRERFEIKIN